jgi:hypothetical protein
MEHQRMKWSLAPLLALALLPGAALARGFAVDVWTDRGSDAVYQPGDAMQVKVRASDDAYVMVYEIDAEGSVHVLYPYQGRSGFMDGRHTYRVPSDDADVSLVVQTSVGQAYLVALASRDPFGPLPWYLRPYNAQAEGVGYEGKPDEEDGVTAEGRIVGDPFVAMERIRRRVLKDPDSPTEFATAYTSYYVQHEVRYPRYLCYDCHRPGQWAWWDGFDPYYAHCSMIDFRVNWSWAWGPSYWFGRVPYFVYVYRTNCPPRYWRYRDQGIWYSSWDGWSRWCDVWGTPSLTRYKSPPPPGYNPPTKFGPRTTWGPAQPTPPGFLVTDMRKRESMHPDPPIGRNHEGGNADDRFDGGLRKWGTGRAPSVAPRDEGEGERTGRGVSRPSVERTPMPSAPPRDESAPRVEPRREERPTPRPAAPREEKPAPRAEPRREERPAPKAEPARDERRPEPAQKPREEGPVRGGRRGGG